MNGYLMNVFEPMKICVQGLWHLGSVTAGCIASVEHEVFGLDFDEGTIQDLLNGKPPIFEPGLTSIIETGLSSGRLKFTANPSDLPNDIEILWVTYDIPVNEDDVADVDLVSAQIKLALPFLPLNATILISSQMPVGSIHQLEIFSETEYPEKALSFAYSPENLRLGKALDVFLKPDRVVVGVRSAKDKERIGQLLQPITDRIEWMSVESAEMTKHAINSFLATSVVFANEIAALCEAVGADAKEVERGLKSEQRIGPNSYLSPGGAFAGGTLARDVEFLKVVSKNHQLHIPLLEAVKVSNDRHKSWVNRKLKSLFPKLEGLIVVVWGLTYKPDTDTLRRSLAVELCDWLMKQGAKVRVHDPVVKNIPADWTDRLQRFDDALDALKGADVLVIGTEHSEYKTISADRVSKVKSTLVVIDPNRFLSIFANNPDLHYIAVGTPARERLI
jgi:UDPglucose 6-dehydrogenase